VARARTLIAAAAGAFVAWRLFGPEIPPRFSGRQERPTRLTGRTVVVGRHEFFVREAGPAGAPPLLLLHGWAYAGHLTWHKVIPVLAEHFRLFVVDLRAHGKTDRVRGRYDIADCADEIAGVLDALGLERVPVVGYSMGGMVAQSLAIRHPSRVSRLVLAATAARPVRLPRWFMVPLFVTGRAGARIDRLIVPRLAHRYLLAVGAVSSEHAAWLWEDIMSRDADLYYQAGFTVLRFDGEGDLDGIAVPTLSIVPTRDQMISPERQRETALRLVDNVMIEIEGARHEVLLTHPRPVGEAIREFLA
jgi:pimeloyl-ACP methyl ester carboxylesterase